MHATRNLLRSQLPWSLLYTSCESPGQTRTIADVSSDCRSRFSLRGSCQNEREMGNLEREARVSRSCLALPNPPSPSPFTAWHAGYSRLSWNSRTFSDSLVLSKEFEISVQILIIIDWSSNSGSPLTSLVHSLWLSRDSRSRFPWALPYFVSRCTMGVVEWIVMTSGTLASWKIIYDMNIHTTSLLSNALIV